MAKGFIYACVSALNVSFTVCGEREWCWHVIHNWCSLERQGEALPLGTHGFGTDVLFYYVILKLNERVGETVRC